MLSVTGTWAIYVIYLGALVGLGFYVWWKNRNNSTRDFYTAGNQINWFVLCMTYMAALMSTWVFFAGPGGYYRGGFGYYMSELSYMPLFPVITYFVMNKVWLLNTQRHYTTPADVFVDRFPSRVLRLILAVVFFSVSMPYAAAIFNACGKAAEVASGGMIPHSYAIIFVGIAVLLFIPFGGVKSIAWLATVQGWLFMIAIWVIGLGSLSFGFNGGIGDAISSVWQTSNNWFSYPGPSKWVPYSARLGYPLACAIGWTIMLPDVFIRGAFFGKDQGAQRKLMYVQPFLQVIVWSGCMVIGFAAIAMVPGLTGSDTELVIPYLVTNIISSKAVNFAILLMVAFVWGTLATGLASACSHILVAGSIISEDILNKLLNLNVNPKLHMVFARLAVCALTVVAVYIALNPPALIWTLIMFAIAIVMPLFPVLLAALYWRRATTTAAIISSVIGVATVLATYFVWNVGDCWYGTFGLVVSTVLMIIISYMTEKTDENVLNRFYSAMDKAEEQYFE